VQILIGIAAIIDGSDFPHNLYKFDLCDTTTSMIELPGVAEGVIR